MSKPAIQIALVWCALLVGCETTPQRAPSIQSPTDPARAAMAEAGRAYSAGDDNRALALYLPVARSGDHVAQIRVARIYARNKGVTPNAKEACNWWEQASSGPDSTAAVNFGLCFESGNGRDQSYAQAVHWYRKASEAGNAYGMYNLGLAHEYGRGVAQSFDLAADWFSKALAIKLSASDNADAQRHLKRSMNHVGAARFDPQALYDLAIDLFNGHDPEVKDVNRAMKAMREAATRGTSPEAWYVYGAWLQLGIGGVKADLMQAAAWTKKAADLGHEQAAIRYANILLCGIGVKKDAAMGERLLRQTISEGSWQAMSELALWHTNGNCGFRKDAALGAQWRERADAAQRAGAEHRQKQR